MGARRIFATAAATFAVLVALSDGAGAATIVVDTTNDELNADADCSLREAVQSANTNSAVSGCAKGQGAKTDTVKLVDLDGDDFGEQFQLSIASTDEDENVNGDLDLYDGGPVTIKGNSRGMGGPEISAPATDRAIDVVELGDRVQIKKLNLDGGNVAGLGSGNDQGGAVRTVDSRVTIADVNIESGNASSGGGVAMDGASLTVRDSFVGDNDASVAGGGVFATNGDLLLDGSGFDGNDAETGDGNVLGGAVAALTETTEIVDTSITFNNVETADSTAAFARGGGIYSASNVLTVRRSLISGNDADDAAGTSDSTGAGIAHFGDRLQVVNSTFFDNDVDGDGGAIHSGPGSVSNVTFLGNEAAGDGDHLSIFEGPVKLRNSILPGQLFTDRCSAAPGDIVSKGYNLYEIDDSGCGFIGRDEDTDQPLGLDGTPLPNGGKTFTVKLEASSPAKDMIPKKACKVARGEDQRGFKRPKGKKCDAGAFERGAKP